MPYALFENDDKLSRAFATEIDARRCALVHSVTVGSLDHFRPGGSPALGLVTLQ